MSGTENMHPWMSLSVWVLEPRAVSQGRGRSEHHENMLGSVGWRHVQGGKKLISLTRRSGSGKKLAGLPSNRPGNPDWLLAAMVTVEPQQQVHLPGSLSLA